MTITFLLEINLDDISTIADVALNIEEDLSDNFDVISVKPWARPTTFPIPPSTYQNQTQT